MSRVRRALIAVGIGFGVAAAAGACSDPATEPDAAVAAVDGALDADTRCAPGFMCLAITPVDGNAEPPPGRLAIAWQPSPAGPLEVAYDQPWAAAAVTEIALTDIAPPSGPYQFPGPCGAATNFGSAAVVVSTDPNGDGAISSDEITAGIASGDTYGIHREIVAWSELGCGPRPPSVPDGLEAGVHVYTRRTPVMLLDGTITELQTCTPNTAACADLDEPF